MKKGFTLIELLIVITIIAILAGAAIPYVQQYVEDGRYARAKQDLDEIRNALVRYETDRGVPYSNSGIGPLVGPFLNKAMADPWGGAYVVATAASKVLSAGPNGIANDGDDVAESFRPPLALTKAFWEDSNQNGVVDNGDGLILKFSRPTNRTWVGGVPAIGDFDFTGACVLAGITVAVADWTNNDQQVRVDLTNITTPFVAGKDTVDFSVTGAPKIVDGAGTAVKTGSPVPIKAR